MGDAGRWSRDFSSAGGGQRTWGRADNDNSLVSRRRVAGCDVASRQLDSPGRRCDKPWRSATINWLEACRRRSGTLRRREPHMSGHAAYSFLPSFDIAKLALLGRDIAQGYSEVPKPSIAQGPVEAAVRTFCLGEYTCAMATTRFTLTRAHTLLKPISEESPRFCRTPTIAALPVYLHGLHHEPTSALILPQGMPLFCQSIWRHFWIHPRTLLH
jgi:hypothetical protein